MTLPSPPGGLPPGVHLEAYVRTGAERDEHQLRILGDASRGYLLAGTLALGAEALEEFWFISIEEAISAAESVGVAREDWSSMTSAADAGQDV
jgi:hypothetical protein